MSSGTTLAIPRLDDGALNRCTGSGEAAGPKLLSATGFTLHLPLPPSVNRLKRTKSGRPLGNRTPEVQSWRREADMSTLMQRKVRGIRGDFAIEIIFDVRARTRHSDLDNRVKPLLDWMQIRELIENDCCCVDLHVHWGDAPRGCIVTVRQVAM